MKQSSANHKDQNRSIRVIVILVLALSVFIVAWFLLGSSAQNVPTMLSLEDKWDLLEISAHNLQEDAYLTNVSLPLNGNTPYTVTAEFHSASVPDKMIFIGIDRFNEIEAEWIDLPPASSEAQDPIQRKDWTIDSQEALTILAKDEIVNECLRSSGSSRELSLNRVMTENPSWVLIILDCPEEGKFQTYYLNAQTGEAIVPFSQ